MAAQTYSQLITAAAASNGVPVSWMTSILNAENPSLNPNALSYTNVQGLSQITQATWNTVNPGVPYSTDPADQLNTQAKLLAKYQDAYDGNLALAAAAYNGGSGVGDRALKLINQGESQDQAIADATSHYYPGNAAKLKEVQNYVAKVTGQTAASASGVNAATTPAYLTDDSDPATAVAVSGMTVSSAQLASVLNAVNPPLIISTGLDQPSPLEDRGILQVNKATAAVGNPVTFQLYFDTNTSPLPIVLSLNASMRTYQRTVRHTTTRQRTLTGLLVNLWGVAPDQISGEASSGMFANQLGISDFLSLSSVSAQVRSQVLQAFSAQGTQPNDVLEAGLSSDPSYFRMAAKDAFVELLALFKNNGTVWFQNQNYTGYTTGLEQMAADAWSPATGSSTFQNAARRNDVMTRGKVLMNFRNSGYFGYFKTLTWTMDAKNPYRWNFNFVFQVESTITNVNLPDL